MSIVDENLSENITAKFEKSHIEFINPQKKRQPLLEEKFKNLKKILANSDDVIDEVVIKGYQFDDQSLKMIIDSLKSKKIKNFHIENCNLTSYQSHRILKEVKNVEAVNFSFNKIKNFIIDNGGVREIVLNFNPLKNVEVVQSQKLKILNLRQVELSEKSFIKIAKNLTGSDLEELSCTTKTGLQLDSIYYEIIDMIQGLDRLRGLSINCKEKVYEKEEIEERVFDSLIKNTSLRLFKLNMGLIGNRDKDFQDRVEVILEANRFIEEVLKGRQDIDQLDDKIADIVKLKLLNLNLQKDMDSLGLKVQPGTVEKPERSQLESTARELRLSKSSSGVRIRNKESIDLLLGQNKTLMNKIYKLESKMKNLIIENQDLKFQLRRKNTPAEAGEVDVSTRSTDVALKKSRVEVSSKKSPNMSSILTKNESDMTNFLSQKPQGPPTPQIHHHKKRFSESVVKAVQQNMKKEMTKIFKKDDSIITRRNSTANPEKYWKSNQMNTISRTSHKNFFTKENYMRRSRTKRLFGKKSMTRKSTGKGLSMSRGDCDCLNPKINIIFKTAGKRPKSGNRTSKHSRGSARKYCSRDDFVMISNNMEKMRKMQKMEAKMRQSCKKILGERPLGSLKGQKRRSRSKEKDSKIQKKMLKALKKTNKNLNQLLKGGSQRSVKSKYTKRKSAKVRKEKSKIGKIEVKKIIENDICEFKHKLEEKLGLLSPKY